MRPFFMSYVRGEDRGQASLLPAAVEDYVAAEGPVRIIDAFVDGLAISGLGSWARRAGGDWRLPYDPRDLLKLYVYGTERGALVAAAGARVPPQCRTDVASASTGAGLQDDCRLSSRQRGGDCRACRALCAVLPGSGAVQGAPCGADGSKFAPRRARRRSGRRVSPRRRRVRPADRRRCPAWTRATPASPTKLRTQRLRRSRRVAPKYSDETE